MKSEKKMFLENLESFHKGAQKHAEVMDENNYEFNLVPEIFSTIQS